MQNKETGLLKGAVITMANIHINECHFQNSKYSSEHSSVPLRFMSFLLEVNGKCAVLKRSGLRPSRFQT
jgi:hypothetical protein